MGIQGQAQASIDSYTFGRLGRALHRFGGTETNPELEHTQAYPGPSGATGLGDVTVRLKYSFHQGSNVHVAALLDSRLPTGDPDNFLGTGVPTFRILGILSKRFGDFTPHLNLGYDYRAGFEDTRFDSDEFEFAVGFDQKIVSGLTFAVDIMGEVDLNNEAVEDFFSGSVEISDHAENAEGVIAISVRKVSKSNVPPSKKIPNQGDDTRIVRDDIINASLGIRFAPTDRVILLANVLIPMNDGGLRSRVIPTAGLAISL